MKIILMSVVKNLATANLHRIKVYFPWTGKVLNMKSILATTLDNPKAHSLKDIKMSIEYHLRKPSIGIFLWTTITNICGAIDKKMDAFNNTRETFYIEYALPIGLVLGYDGVGHQLHFDRDFFTPYLVTDDEKVYPSIRGHEHSPQEEIKKAYSTLSIMDRELFTASKVLPDLYRQLLKKK